MNARRTRLSASVLVASALLGAGCGSDDQLAEPADSLAFAEQPITVTCDEAGADIETERHDISNVVVEQVGGEHTKFEDMSGKRYRVDMADITTVWVKAGNNKSDDGPGYGKRFDCESTPGLVEGVSGGQPGEVKY